VRYSRCFCPELEKTLVEWVLSERLKGNKVSSSSILLKARRFAEENKIENFNAYPSWAFRFMRRNNLCIRSTSSVWQKLPDDCEAKTKKFRLYVKENLCDVDPAHFGNMDEVPVSFDLPGSRTVHSKGAKEVSVATAPVSCVWKLTRYKNGKHMNNKLNNLMIRNKYMNIPHSNKNTYPP
jgi:hypothetical protein